MYFNNILWTFSHKISEIYCHELKCWTLPLHKFQYKVSTSIIRNIQSNFGMKLSITSDSTLPFRNTENMFLKYKLMNITFFPQHGWVCTNAVHEFGSSSDSPMWDCTTVMRLVVRVPVLSEQMAVALPMVSHASRWRTRLLSFIIFYIWNSDGKQRGVSEEGGRVGLSEWW